MVFTCSIDLHLVPTDAGKGMLLLRSVVGYTRSLPGCLGCVTWCDASECEWLHYSETWTTEEAFRRHVQSARFRPVLMVLDMASEEPQVMVGKVYPTGGLSYLLSLCEQQERGAV